MNGTQRPGDNSGSRQWMGLSVWAIGLGLALVLLTTTLVLVDADDVRSTSLSVRAQDNVVAGSTSSDSPTGLAVPVDETPLQEVSVDEVPLQELTFSATETASVLAGEQPEQVTQRTFTGVFSLDEPEPSEATIDSALAAFVGVLGDAGYRGVVHIEAGVFVLYAGAAPGSALNVVVTVSPATAGGHENYARQTAALNYDANANSAVPVVGQGIVLLGESVAYGRSVGAEPHEWVAVQLESEFYVVSIDHRSVDTVMGPEPMIRFATDVVSELGQLGLTTVEQDLLNSKFAEANPSEASVLWTILSTRCPPGVPSSVCTRPLLDSAK